jgi:hypothetical protein
MGFRPQVAAIKARQAGHIQSLSEAIDPLEGFIAAEYTMLLTSYSFPPRIRYNETGRRLLVVTNTSPYQVEIGRTYNANSNGNKPSDAVGPDAFDKIRLAPGAEYAATNDTGQVFCRAVVSAENTTGTVVRVYVELADGGS